MVDNRFGDNSSIWNRLANSQAWCGAILGLICWIIKILSLTDIHSFHFISLVDLRKVWILWYLLTIVLSVILRLWLLISPLVYFGHCIISHSSIASSDFPFWYLLAIVLSVILRLRYLLAKAYLFMINWYNVTIHTNFVLTWQDSETS
jgi:hypothetical protein